MGNQGKQRKNSLNLNLNGGKLIKFGKSRCAKEKQFEFEFKERKINKIGKLGCVKEKMLDLNIEGWK